jgi:proline-specific peptidase
MNRRDLLLAGLALTTAPIVARAASLAMPDPALWAPFEAQRRAGRAPGPNGEVAYWIYGQQGRTPVIVLHGGPCADHVYMRPFAALADDRPVVLYDQSGCGASAKPADLGAYSVDRYVAELEALRAHLGYDRVCLIGHSWGGMLALAYGQAYGDRVERLVLAGTAPRLVDFTEAANIWLEQFGPDARAVIQRAEASGTFDDPAYLDLTDRYYHRHLCRLDPWPAWLVAVFERLATNPVYKHLNGPSEFQFGGALDSMDLRPGLGSIRARALVSCGEYDEAPHWVARNLAAAMPRADVQVFTGLSHLTHVEDPRVVVAATRNFLDKSTGE